MDACPYPLDSDARTAWLEGYHGAPSDRAPDLPMDSGGAVAAQAHPAIP